MRADSLSRVASASLGAPAQPTGAEAATQLRECRETRALLERCAARAETRCFTRLCGSEKVLVQSVVSRDHAVLAPVGDEFLVRQPAAVYLAGPLARREARLRAACAAQPSAPAGSNALTARHAGVVQVNSDGFAEITEFAGESAPSAHAQPATRSTAPEIIELQNSLSESSSDDYYMPPSNFALKHGAA